MAATCNRAAGVAALFAVGLALVGCSSEPPTGTVSGTVTVDGAIPADGSSISFIPTNGATAGGLLDKGKYKATVPVGPCKVEIRIPRPLGKGRAAPAAHKDGPGSGPSVGGIIEESLPDEYNAKSTLTLDVKPGPQEKNWEVKAKK